MIIAYLRIFIWLFFNKTNKGSEKRNAWQILRKMEVYILEFHLYNQCYILPQAIFAKFFWPYNPKSTHFYFVSFFNLLGKPVSQLFFSALQFDFLRNFAAIDFWKIWHADILHGKEKIRNNSNINAAWRKRQAFYTRRGGGVSQYWHNLYWAAPQAGQTAELPSFGQVHSLQEKRLRCLAWALFYSPPVGKERRIALWKFVH